MFFFRLFQVKIEIPNIFYIQKISSFQLWIIVNGQNLRRDTFLFQTGIFSVDYGFY